ncbi:MULTISPECIES: HesA/MoeB/ThiF family protein [Sphingobium]|uniref:HesA/MoeB/ThiF family protein n=1 Tax=Sphingobium TaxID=165695 RepID=UPI000C6AB105|nr:MULTISPECIES: HesA/MoeB/ThiF family protein [Sphingobium]MBA37928.1 molybdopterin biosynthesis protein MoeB [Sphingobium sp.]MBS48223.1 molybdopterin biosynthesis protein MoeB [Sphingobium sp.]MCC4257047.1 HesA/MoeB/ThiF family protein [Sphingobium lactosutens]MEE2741945.1 HesA/MoeB/ThiF family protein [Pseudomonadota bacterium]
MTLTDAQLDRYARHIVLREIGGAGQMRLLNADVVVIGAGGIGSPAILYLAAAGVGTIRVIDDDVVALSNLQRQVLFGTDDIGSPKAEAAMAAVARINPDVKLIPINARIDADNAGLMFRDADVVLDGCDNFATRLIVADAAQRLRIPLVSAAVGPFEGQMATYRGWEADKPCYRCLVGDPQDAPERNCAETGVIGALTGTIGSLAALETIRALVPFGTDMAGQLLIADLLTMRFRTVDVAKDPACSGCAMELCAP